MGEKGNMLDTASMTGFGSGLGDTGDIVGTSVDRGDTGSSTGHGSGAALAAKMAAQHMREQLAGGAGQRTTVEGLPLGTEKPSDSK